MPGRVVTRTAWAIMVSRSNGLLAARVFSNCWTRFTFAPSSLFRSGP